MLRMNKILLQFSLEVHKTFRSSRCQDSYKTHSGHIIYQVRSISGTAAVSTSQARASETRGQCSQADLSATRTSMGHLLWHFHMFILMYEACRSSPGFLIGRARTVSPASAAAEKIVSLAYCCIIFSLRISYSCIVHYYTCQSLE